MNRVILSIVLAMLCATDIAVAADASLQSEIVYRTNLGRAEDVQLLLKQGASPNQIDQNGVPLLALAATRKDKEGLAIAKVLIEAGANVNSIDTQGQTSLFYAARAGNKEVVTYLLEQKANYYLADQNGTIARTVAHKAGHEDIVALMDKFVTDQTEAVNQQYKDYNETIQKRYQQIKREGEEHQKEFAEAQAEVLARAQQAGSDSDHEPEVQDIGASQVNIEALKKTMRDLSFHSCAFQYWSFCHQVKQTTDLSPEELSIAINSHRDQISALSLVATDTYQVKKKDVTQVTKNAQQRVANQLNVMPSGTYRFEHGVCKTPDVTPRCEDIANNWSTAAVKPLSQKKTSSTGGGMEATGKGGKHGIKHGGGKKPKTGGKKSGGKKKAGGKQKTGGNKSGTKSQKTKTPTKSGPNVGM